MPVLPRPAPDRFWEKVDKKGPNDCWIWKASTNGRDYGQFGLRKGAILLAHRYAFELLHGPIPVGLCICHKCDVRRCVNPDHLFLGTVQDNQRDMAKKGRAPKAKLTPFQVLELRRRHAEGESIVALSQRFGLAHSSTRSAATGETWKLLPMSDLRISSGKG